MGAQTLHREKEKLAFLRSDCSHNTTPRDRLRTIEFPGGNPLPFCTLPASGQASIPAMEIVHVDLSRAFFSRASSGAGGAVGEILIPD